MDNIFTYQYKTKNSFLILSLIYPERDWKDKIYHEDHIFPKSEFTEAKLKKRGYSEENIRKYLSYYNSILNIELLTDIENLEKSAIPFDEWLEKRDHDFKKRH